MKIYTSIMLTIIFAMSAAGIGAGQTNLTFSGVVIFFSDEYIELKKGKTELKVYRDAQAVMENKTGDEGQAALSLCQKARAYYVVQGGKARLVKLQILSPGYCGG